MDHLNKKEIIAQLTRHGIDQKQIKDLHLKLQLGQISYDSFIIEADRLKAPLANNFYFYQKQNQEELRKLAIDSLKRDELLIFWLNGGAATRYFDDSKILPPEKKRFTKELQKITPALKNLPKGITPVINDLTYLELKIKNLLKITVDLKLPKHPPVLLMNSFLTDEPTKKYLNQLYKKYSQLIPSRFHFIVQQPKIPRFKKIDNLKNTDLFIDQKGLLSFAPSGHGDFLYLTREYFKEEKISNVKYMFFNNIDNFGSFLDLNIFGFHIKQGLGRTVEVALKNKGDKGGAPCLVDNQMQIVEQMKFPPKFDQNQLKYFNTNNFWFTMADLLSYEENLPLVLAEKKILGEEVIQIEHFACDVNLPSRYLVVPRELRFWPAKRYLDLLIYQYPNNQNKQEKKYHQLLKSLLKTNFSLDLP